jgi:hypothetical protein
MLFVACVAFSSDFDSAPQGAQESIEYTVIDKGITSGKRFPSLHFDLIGEAAPFKKLFAELHSDQLPAPLPPEIDFESSSVVFVSMGEKPSAGYRVEIDQIKRSGPILKVKLRLLEPSPGQMNATMITQPFVMAKVKKEKGIKKVEFLDQKGEALYLMSVSE